MNTSLALRLFRVKVLKLKTLKLGVSAFFFSLIVLSGNIAAQQVEEITQNVSDRIMSPFCPGRTLSGCPSDKARALRDQIRGWVAEGDDEASVIKRLQNIYGEEIFGMPGFSAVELLFWAVPIVVLLLGLTYILLRIRRLQKPVGSESSKKELASADQDAREELEEEVLSKLL